MASMEKSFGRRFKLAVLISSLWELSASEFEVINDFDDCANPNMLPYGISMCSEDILLPVSILGPTWLAWWYTGLNFLIPPSLSPPIGLSHRSLHRLRSRSSMLAHCAILVACNSGETYSFLSVEWRERESTIGKGVPLIIVFCRLYIGQFVVALDRRSQSRASTVKTWSATPLPSYGLV